jgi:hypothetical protein
VPQRTSLFSSVFRDPGQWFGDLISELSENLDIKFIWATDVNSRRAPGFIGVLLCSLPARY